MTQMQAAVLSKLGTAPQYQTVSMAAIKTDKSVVKVIASSLKQLDRAIVAGTHYGSPKQEMLPVVCGTDGVGINAQGEKVYFQTTSSEFGAMAEYAPTSMMVKIPESLNDNMVAALVNPAIGAWLPLAWRAKMVQGETVLIMGATGDTGKQALAIARILGAKKVIAAGRKRSGLMALAADEYIDTEQDDVALLADFQRLAKRGVDIIIDYLWGKPAELMIQALMTQTLKVDEKAGERGIRYVSVGALAGRDIQLPSGVFRSSFLTLLGSGTGNFPPKPLLEDMVIQILREAEKGNLTI
ncbi:MAG TPA: zinc-binding alcohol dehydrogenase family protein, partial [Candidatus Ignatzschineria merdigallinarum]|nr:zinc-binding alcohol dehydrogenase family protein [Candidatus Ignatzschineria merdigallinarum]